MTYNMTCNVTLPKPFIIYVCIPDSICDRIYNATIILSLKGIITESPTHNLKNNGAINSININTGMDINAKFVNWEKDLFIHL